MQNRTRLLLIVLLVLAVGNAFIYFSLLGKTTVVITLTENGFVPEEINITRGDTVRFVSDLNREFWPASDSHPTHRILSEFDPKQPIAFSDSWDYTFKKLGSWQYHDHLAPQFTGVINVYSKYGQATSDCVDRDLDSLQEECWIEEFKLAYEEGGFDKIFKLFKEYQAHDEVFASNCHDIMHLLGDFAYEEYAREGKVFDQPETSYCSFGFYHGFIEHMIEATGDYAISREYCQRLRTDGDFPSAQIALDAEGACVHGFGHAIFDSLDGSLWGDDEAMVNAGLKVCEDVFEGEFYVSECGTGIWNALAIAYIRPWYNLTFIKDKLPFDICLQVDDLYKPGCYVEMMIQFSHWNDNSRKQDFALMHDVVEPIAQERVYEAYVSDAVQWRLPYDYKVIAEYGDQCFALEEQNLLEWCQMGIHHGVLKRTSPFVNQEESQKICNEYTDPYKKEICEKMIIKKI